MNPTLIQRRALLKGAGAMMVVGFSLQGCATAGADKRSAGLLPPPKSVAKDAVDSFVGIGRDGRITIYTGKVDLGTGTKTALAQMAADELDVPFERITMVMGDTATTPDQWITGANLTISQGGGELRRAAATARHALVDRASKKLGVPAAELIVVDGVVVSRHNPGKSVAYAELIGDQQFALAVDPKAPLKAAKDYKVVGQPIARVDIPAKVSGEFIYVHDFRLPGMLHARVVRADALGARLQSFDDSAARKVSGYVQTVRKGDFIAVVARSEWGAIKAAQALTTQWSAGTGLPEQAKIYEYWRGLPVAKQELTQNVGDAPATIAASAKRVKASYEFPVQTHASLGPSCAVARFEGGELTIWSASQATHSMQHEVASVVGLPMERIRLVYLDGSGCYGRNGHEDATADAALVATLIGKPVRVQWSRADETARAPKSAPRVMDMEAGLDAQGNVQAWSGDFYIALNHIAAFKPLDFPLLAATDTGLAKPGNWVGFLFQNSAAPYAFPHTRVNTRHLASTPFRSSHLRSPGRIENSFANESFADELALAAGMDPAAFRLKHLKDPRGIAVIEAATKRAGWQTRVGPNPAAAGGDVLKGRGISYVRYNNSSTYVATVAEVEVNRRTGAVLVKRMCIGHDCGQIINPDGLANQIEGGAIQTVGRTLIESVQWDATKVTSVDWATYPILTADAVPKVEVDMIDRPGETSWGAGEPTATTIPAAIANAVFDATGVRLRTLPLTPERVLAGLAAQRKAA